MAIVKTVKEVITTDEHMCNSIEYNTRATKAYKVVYKNCIIDTPENVTTQFKNTRVLYQKNKNIFGHMLVQSFAEEDNISPELAHKIGIELMEKCFPDFQVVMATHIDGKYIHNQYIINSVCPLDGRKFLGNKKTINMLRKVSDEICAKNNLSIVSDDTSKYSGLDGATLNLAKRGKSWKFNLVKDIDKALEICNSKDEFIMFFEKNDYAIKYSDNHITFQKNGEMKKGIRADTLAKQFGMKYSKAGIDKKLNVIATTKNTNAKQNTDITAKRLQYQSYQYNKQAQSEWKRYEKRYKDKIKIRDKRYFDNILYSKNPLQFTLNLIMYIFRKANKTPKSKLPLQGNHYKIKSKIDYQGCKKIIGNIPYYTMLNTPGDTVQIKLYSWQIAKLLNNKVLLSSKIDLKTGTGIVTIKNFDIPKIAKFLNTSEDMLLTQAKKIKNRKSDFILKQNGEKLSYLVVTKEQVELLDYHLIKFVCYPKEDKYNIGFLQKDKDKVLSILYPNRKEDTTNKETFFKRNARLNRELHQKSEQTGEKLCYKIIGSNQYKALQDTTLEFAVFRQKDGNYNVVFLENNKAKIEKVIGGVSNVKTKSKTTTTSEHKPNPKI